MQNASNSQADRCPRCGESNQCDYGGAEPCWCAVEFPLVASVVRSGACYCRRCLAIQIEERRIEASTTAPEGPVSRPG